MITGWLHLRQVATAYRGGTGEICDDGTILGRAVKFIHEHATRDIQVRDVAAHVRASRRWLDGQFVEQLGRTPHEEIVRVRFARVERLLSQSDLSLEEIASQSGFRHAEYMSAAFKRRYGTSPGRWRGRRISRVRRRQPGQRRAKNLMSPGARRG